MEVEQPAPQVQATTTAELHEDDDEELQFVGRTGQNALSDFPHSRENCLESKWRPGAEAKACANCFCYVCDAPVKQCPQWRTHCAATHTQEKWRRARTEWKASGGAAATAPAAAAAASSSSSSSSSAAASSSSALMAGHTPTPASEQTRWSAERILKAVEQVYPVEDPDPPGLGPGLSLRPYQRQSVAYMLAMERSTDYSLRGNNGRMSNLRGGWLADEMGMGKTAVCSALVLASKRDGHCRGTTVVLCNNTLVGQWIDELRKFAPGLTVRQFYGSSVRRVTRDIDIIVTTPNTAPPDELIPLAKRLIIDESHLYEKRADPKQPSTKILGNRTKHGKGVSGNGYRPDFMWCVTGTPFSHSLAQLSTQAMMLGQWSSGAHLDRLVNAVEFTPPQHDPPMPHERHLVSNQAIVDKLKTLMIRHTKSQRLAGGEQALSLPESDCQTVWLTMTDDERTLYDLHACSDGVPKWADANRMTDLTLQDVRDGLGKRRQALAHSYSDIAVSGAKANGALYAKGRQAFSSIGRPYVSVKVPDKDGALGTDVQPNPRRPLLTKYAALLGDLNALVAAEGRSGPVSVVVFTHFNEVLTEVSNLLRAKSYQVFEVSRTTEPSRRHRALRSFQAGSGGGGGADASATCRIFATTFSTAAVGLTLTAAARVYLLEASLDPAQEAQAAGRIHRLGQTKEVLVKRLLYRDSLDTAIDALHEQIRSGGVSFDGGKFPREALRLLQQHGIAQPHARDDSAPMVETDRRYTSDRKHNVALYGTAGGFDYGKKVQTQPCKSCGKPVEVPGTSVWWGLGCWRALDGCKDDFPRILQGDGGALEDSEDEEGSDDDAQE